MREIDPKSIAENAIGMMDDSWMLVTAGTRERFNSMTASWGGLGELWHHAVAFVFVRPQRYTFSFTEANDRMTLSFYDEQYRKALNIMGSKSGRDCDKPALAGLTPAFTDSGTPYFKEARLVLECRKLYSSKFAAEGFVDRELLNRIYPNGDFHTAYIVAIEHAYVAE